MSASLADTPLNTAELAAQTAPRIITELPGPVARTIIERDERFTSPSLTRVYPLVVGRGAGAVLEDVDGNRFLDFNAGIAVNAAGHAHPAVTEAITAQAERCLHYCSSDFYHPVYAELCERLSASAPMPDARTFLANSGTEAVEAALKLARYHTRRPNVIAFYGGFHGRSLGFAVAHVVEGEVPQRLRHRHTRQLPRAVRLRRRGHGRRVHRVRPLPAHDRAERRRRRVRRADPGRGWLHRASRRLAR